MPPDSPDHPHLDALPMSVDGDVVRLVFDAGHVAAHLGDFSVPWRYVVELIASALTSSRTSRSGVVHQVVRAERIVGMSGCVPVASDSGAFWARRRGRAIPSHVVIGHKVPTHDLCVWGEWTAADEFRLFTCYPGRPAPREIHDPGITPDELTESVEFWSSHALVIESWEELDPESEVM